MSDNLNENTNTTEQDSDNMAQNPEMDEALANVLNTDDSRAGGDLLNEGEDEEITKLQAELDEVKDKHIRLIAEFDNFRRRTAKERVEEKQLAGKEIIQSMLGVLDDLGRAEKQIENTTDIAAMKEGLALVFNKLRHTLQQKGLKMMETGKDEFNADLHEAITEIPAPTEAMKGKIIDVIEPGYYLNDKLIRYAKVVVGN